MNSDIYDQMFQQSPGLIMIVFQSVTDIGSFVTVLV